MERNGGLTKNARTLRKTMTKEEAHLWYQFLCRYQPRFHRQYVIGNYIADFYCHQAKLVVELDGSQHYDPENIQKDAARTEYLKGYDLTVLRSPNNEVMQNFDGVCLYIHNEVSAALARQP